MLEIGCGCLSAGVALIAYLDAGNYVGIEPNTWLLDAARTSRRTRWLLARKRATFLARTDFDASGLGRRFDYVLAHSILSHCAHWQLEQFVANVARVLRPSGRVVASIRLADADSRHDEWQYPGVSWFSLATVEETAARHGLRVRVEPSYTERLVARRPHEIHDWLVFSS